MYVAEYIKRIEYSGALSPTHETLRALQVAHLLAVPFENLDIVPLHRPIQLDEASLWDKIVKRGRGGFCYELNGLFAWLLQQVGFEVTYLNARVFNREGKLGIDFDHLALLVRVPGDNDLWLADVGFGDSFTEPLAFHEGEQPQGLRSYRLERDPAGYTAWQRNYDGSWERLFFFDLIGHRFPADYESACAYHQKSPESSFTRDAIISKATEDGRVTLQHDTLIITRNGERAERPIKPDAWPSLLLEHFNVAL